MRKQAGLDKFDNFPGDKKNYNTTTSTSVSNSSSSTSGNFSVTTSNTSSDLSSVAECSNSLESRPGGYISVCQDDDQEDYGDSIEMKPRAKSRRRKGVFRFIRERIHKIISKREKQLT